VHLGRRLTTVLPVVTMVTMRGTAHGVAALHRLLGRGHANTVESIRCESDGQGPGKNPLSRPHQGSRLVVLDERVKAYCAAGMRKRLMHRLLAAAGNSGSRQSASFHSRALSCRPDDTKPATPPSPALSATRAGARTRCESCDCSSAAPGVAGQRRQGWPRDLPA